MFYKKVDLRSKKAMVEYLENHFRYYTMNSWNRQSSYAQNVKLHNLGLNREQYNKAFDIIEEGSFYHEAQHLMDGFAEKWEHRFQAGFNGRSDGYLVLYQGDRTDSGYTTRCDICGRLTWYQTEQPCHVDNCGGTLRVLESPVFSIKTSAGGLDMYEIFEQWDMDSLKWRMNIVREFDRLCDSIRDLLLYYIENYEVVEEQICVPGKIKVLKSVKKAA